MGGKVKAWGEAGAAPAAAVGVLRLRFFEKGCCCCMFPLGEEGGDSPSISILPPAPPAPAPAVPARRLRCRPQHRPAVCALCRCTQEIRRIWVGYWSQADATLGQKIAQKLSAAGAL